MTRTELFNTIKADIQETTKNNEEVYTIVLMARVYRKYHTAICGKASSMKEAEAIVENFKEKYGEVLNENFFKVSYLWANTAHTPSSLVSNMAFQR